MKKNNRLKRKMLWTATLLLLSGFIACSHESDPEIDDETIIEGISFENYPKVDGSTSARELNVMIACRLLGVPCGWVEPGVVSEWTLHPKYEEVSEQYKNFFWEHVKSSQTHGAFMNLIDGNADIILTHRTISPDEKAHADAAGVTLIETPIALDAFVFVVNKNNPVKSLTVSQVQQIYTRRITNWSQVGGNNADMEVFTRPRNSGSEEVFRTLVMDGIEPAEFLESHIGGMFQVFDEVRNERDGICYTFNTFKNLQARIPDSEVPRIAINSVFPDTKNIKNGTYPFISKVHVAIRSDLDHNSMAYKMYEWLQTKGSNKAIIEAGYIPISE